MLHDEKVSLIESNNGYDIVMTSNVPHGAGMSNSAANCVALGTCFQACYPQLGLQTPLGK